MKQATGQPAGALRPRRRKRSGVNYAKWGYIFLIPFCIVYLTCSLYPQILTIYNSFFENYMSGLKHIGPKYVGFDNFVKLFTPDKNGTIDFLKFFGNTMIMWVAGAIPQIVIALLLAVFFTSFRLNLKGQRFFKTVIYMPNLIMAAAFSMLFFTLLGNTGPINQLLLSMEWVDEPIHFFSVPITLRGIVALMNFLMWFGNSTILLMAGIMGIDQALFESATIDGASSFQVFRKVTLPLLKPILVYTVITAMLGGLQMYDVPQVITDGKVMANNTGKTMVMYLQNFLSTSKNYGMAGAVSTILFIISAVLSIFVFRSLVKPQEDR